MYCTSLATALIVVIALTLVASDPTLAQDPAPDGWTRVTRLIDGDTVELESSHRVRLFGASAPEVNQPCGPEATSQLRAFLTDNNRDFNVYLEYGPRQADEFGRTLAYLWVYDPPDDAWYLIDEWMVLTGYAEAWTADGQHRDRILAAEEIAVREDAGCLWSGRAAPPSTPRPSVAPAPPLPASNCHPSYPTVCLPYPPDLDCPQISARRFPVLPPDPHRLDGDNDGIGCE